MNLLMFILGITLLCLNIGCLVFNLVHPLGTPPIAVLNGIVSYMLLTSLIKNM